MNLQLGLSEAQRGSVPLLLTALRPTQVHHGDSTGGDEACHTLAREFTRAWIVAHPGDIAAKRAHYQADEIRNEEPDCRQSPARLHQAAARDGG